MLILLLKIIGSALLVAGIFAVIFAGIVIVSLGAIVGFQLAASDFFIDGLKLLKTKFKRK